MAQVRCADGSVLSVLPVPVQDRDGVPYEVTLRLERDATAFGEVGERCGYFLASTTARLRAARAGDDEFPDSSVEAGLRAWARDRGQDSDGCWAELEPYLPRDRELFCFRARDPDDLSTVGELRVCLEVERTWVDAHWAVRCLAVLQAWGSGGTGTRAVLTSDELLSFLEDLVHEFAGVGATYGDGEDASVLSRPVG